MPKAESNNAVSGEWTVLKVLQWTTAYFEEKDVESPRPSAEILLADLLGIERIELYVRFDQPLESEELAEYKSRIKRRVSGEPVAYVTGKKGFWSLDFSVTPSVLIPRPDTETLVEYAISFLKDRPAPLILDLGVGSGTIALSLAESIEDSTVYASDISADAVAVARKNACDAGLLPRVNLIVSDWFSGLGTDLPLFDLVVSNPPYIETSQIEQLQVEITDFEPRLALDGDEDGLRPYKIMVPQAHSYLKSGGLLMFEIGDTQGDAVCDMIRSTGYYESPLVSSDLSGKPRMVTAVRR